MARRLRPRASENSTGPLPCFCTASAGLKAGASAFAARAGIAHDALRDRVAAAARAARADRQVAELQLHAAGELASAEISAIEMRRDRAELDHAVEQAVRTHLPTRTPMPLTARDGRKTGPDRKYRQSRWPGPAGGAS